MLLGRGDRLGLWDRQENRDPGEREERRARREVLAPVAEMVSPVFLETPAPLDPRGQTDPLALVETLLLIWPVDLMINLQHKWA